MAGGFPSQRASNADCVSTLLCHHVVIVPHTGGGGLLPTDCRPCLGQRVSCLWLVPYCELRDCCDESATRFDHVGRHFVVGDCGSKSDYCVETFPWACLEKYEWNFPAFSVICSVGSIRDNSSPLRC